MNFLFGTMRGTFTDDERQTGKSGEGCQRDRKRQERLMRMSEKFLEKRWQKLA